jgi:hypothetical protein
MKLYYNLVTDDVIIPNYHGNAFITLSREKVNSFTIGDHVFVALNGMQSSGIATEGFYEVLFDGEPGLYARREKRLDLGTGSEEAKYIQLNTYFLRKNNIFYRVEDKSSLLDLLKDQEDLLKKFIRANKLKFKVKKDLESSLVLTTKYYSRLKH